MIISRIWTNSEVLIFILHANKDPKEPDIYIRKEEPEDTAEPESPKTEEEEMEEAFMADEHDDFPEDFMEREDE